MYNFSANEVVIDGVYYNINEIRDRAINYLPSTFSKYFIKCINKGGLPGKPMFTYDLDGFLFRDGQTNPEIPRWFFQLNKYCFDQNIRPVPGFSPDTVSDAAGVDMIYRAITKNFILANDIKVNTTGKYQGHAPIEVSSARDINKTTALTILIGITKMHNFDPKEAIELTGATKEDIEDNWTWFKEFIRTAIKPEENIPEGQLAKAKRFYTKTQLVLNYLNRGSFLANELKHLH